MSHPRFLADHDLNEHIVYGVVRREPLVEFLRVRDVGMQESGDAEILKYAAHHALLIVSHDVNTMTGAAHRRIAAGEPMAGVLSEAEEWRDRIGFLPL